LGTKEKVSIPSVDIRGYARYVLRGGSDVEKRELLSCLRGKIILKNKEIILNHDQ
jgi:hypothetical protein